MKIDFKIATADDSDTIGALVIELTSEISSLTKSAHFDIDLHHTVQQCRELIMNGSYAAIIGYCDGIPVAVATLAETYALYAKGKVGVIQEFYVLPNFRSSGIGAMLIEQVQEYGNENKWSSIELCTPPLPEFDRTLQFYQRNGLAPVGGRKMRQMLV